MEEEEIGREAEQEETDGQLRCIALSKESGFM